MTILASAVIATLYRKQRPGARCRGFWHGTLIHGRPMGILLALLCFFAVSLIVISRRLNLYSPTRLSNILHEQRLSMQACLTSGLLLTGALYLVHAEDISRSHRAGHGGLVTVLLSLRRLVYRLLLYRSFEHGVGTRNVLIVGTGPRRRPCAIIWRAFAIWDTHSRASLNSPAPLRVTPRPQATWWAHSIRSSSTPASSLWMRYSSPRPVSAASFRTPRAGSHPRRGSAHCSRDVRWPDLEQLHRIHRPVSHHSVASRRSARGWAGIQARARCCHSPSSY